MRATEDLSPFNLDFLLPVDRVTVDGRRAVFDRRPAATSWGSPRAAPARPASGSTSGRVRRVPRAPGYDGERNWLATTSEVVTMNQPHMAPWWFPANDHPRDKALVDIRITVPRGKQVIANGRRVSRQVHGDAATTTGGPTSRWCRTSRSSRPGASWSTGASATGCRGWSRCRGGSDGAAAGSMG